jgi:hypothetical protein
VASSVRSKRRLNSDLWRHSGVARVCIHVPRSRYPSPVAFSLSAQSRSRVGVRGAYHCRQLLGEQAGLVHVVARVRPSGPAPVVGMRLLRCYGSPPRPALESGQTRGGTGLSRVRNLGVQRGCDLIMVALPRVQRFIAAARPKSNAWASSEVFSKLATRAACSLAGQQGEHAFLYGSVTGDRTPKRVVVLFPPGRGSHMAPAASSREHGQLRAAGVYRAVFDAARLIGNWQGSAGSG